jgi:GT2 family glycosyltransferase
MKQDPLVSVVILHYQRRDALKRTLASVRRQSYANREIIVVVNGPHDDIRGLLEGEAAEVRLVQLDHNLGACGGRNAGIVAARGDIIIVLDNDMVFEEPCAIDRIVEILKTRSDIHVLAFKVCDGETGALLVRTWCHPKYWKEFCDIEFETDHFVEGAYAARREVYERAGLYYEPLFFGAEGWDLVLRLIERGFRILYVPSIRVRHMTDEETRPGERPYYFYTRAYIWTAAKDYPLVAGTAFLAVKLSMMLYFAFRTRHVRAFARGVRDGFAGVPGVLRDRTPVSRSTLRYVRQLEQTRPSFRLRLERHREAVQL